MEHHTVVISLLTIWINEILCGFMPFQISLFWLLFLLLIKIDLKNLTPVPQLSWSQHVENSITPVVGTSFSRILTCNENGINISNIQNAYRSVTYCCLCCCGNLKLIWISPFSRSNIAEIITANCVWLVLHQNLYFLCLFLVGNLPGVSFIIPDYESSAIGIITKSKNNEREKRN